MLGPVTKFMNCFILRGHKIQKEDLYVRDGRVLNPEPFFYEERKSPDRVIDCHGCLIAPGIMMDETHRDDYILFVQFNILLDETHWDEYI